jgi:Ion channel
MVLLGLFGILLILLVLWDVFETILLPRRVTRSIWLASFFFSFCWALWSYFPRRMEPTRFRETFLGFYGPLSLLLLLGWWASALILGFALLHEDFETDLGSQGGDLGDALYYSGTTFVTLGLGDLAPGEGPGRFLTVLEAGVGFAFLALVISYLPVLYQAFSRREVAVSMLDARAGSPPSAGELLRRHGAAEDPNVLQALLQDWEHWAAEVLESHLSFPILCYFRSQHQRQSWVTGLTAILDTSSLLMVSGHPSATKEAELAFRVGRHAMVDLSQTLRAPPKPFVEDRLSPADLDRLRLTLEEHAVPGHGDPELHAKLAKLRYAYEPYVHSLSALLLMQVPPWIPDEGQLDDWEVSAWEY